MSTVTITGLSSRACERMAEFLSIAMEVKVRAPSYVLDRSPIPPDAGPVVWLYQAPWSLSDADLLVDYGLPASELMSRWLATHRAVLRVRRGWGGKLILVNLQRTTTAELGAALGCESLLPEIGSQAVPDELLALEEFVAQHFELSSPEHWDLFEALEAHALKPALSVHAATGARGKISTQSFLRLYQIVVDGLSASELNKFFTDAKGREKALNEEVRRLQFGIDEARVQSQARTEEFEAQRTALQQEKAGLEIRLKESQAEGNLLLRQLHKAQEELEELLVNGHQQAAATAALQERHHAELDQAKLAAATDRTNELAQAREQHKALVSELHVQKSALKEMETLSDRQAAMLEIKEAAVMAAEKHKEALQSQIDALHLELKEQLEKFTAESGKAAQDLARLKNALLTAEQSSNEKSAAVEALQLQVKQATEKLVSRSRELEAVQAAAGVATAEQGRFQETLALAQQKAEECQLRFQDMQEENELLLQQMHQVQEDLERYYMENTALQSAMAESDKLLNRARKLISRLMPDDGSLSNFANAPAVAGSLA